MAYRLWSKRNFHKKTNRIVQLSDETIYEGGDLEFGITDKSGKKTIRHQEHEEVS